jgi:N5-(carboxyethyl)ornithine synthase
MRFAVITSIKENEKRVPIHPGHIAMIPEVVRGSLFFQKGYGKLFNMEDEEIRKLTGNEPVERGELLRSFPGVLVAKPVLEDFKALRDGATVCGWIHSVQQPDVTQIAIDRKLTCIAWENMYHRTSRENVHIFYKNNEMAGYCGVQHALQLRGIDGNFGPARKVCVISMGSVSRGAIYALKGHGFSDITVFTRRPIYLASNKVPGIRYRHIETDPMGIFHIPGGHREKTPLIHELANADIIINGLLQDPKKPVYFIRDEDIERFGKQCLVIDISCDSGMGFSFAHPTDFTHPISRIGRILYYAVDHTPTLLWDSASWEISNGVLPFLRSLVDETKSVVLDEATDIRKGKVLNRDILEYQNRSAEYPYAPLP